MTTSAMGVLAAAKLRGRLVARGQIDARTRDRLFALLTRHFTGVDRQTFEADLAEKTAVILLEDDDDRVRGFSTVLVYSSTAAGRPMSIVCSGDTIVERPWWGSPVLARTWIHGVRALAASLPDHSGVHPCGHSAIQPLSHSPRAVYWLLLTSGFRTYRFLPVFFKAFWPCLDAGESHEARAVIDALARERFGDRYDPRGGIVRFVRPQVLAGELLVVPDGRAQDPHVRFFLERNPGYVRGDELVCLTRIDDDNLTPAGRRMARSSPS